jgi:tRNA pseudouridine13 synthase
MPKIKQVPEDFVVKEIFRKQRISKGGEEKGFYVWFTLRKRNWDLFEALKTLSRRLGVSIKRFGYAGVKDKRGITYQRISIWNFPVERLKEVKVKDLELSDFEIKKERINLGDLKANRFEIVIRDIDERERTEKNLERIGKEGFINYFGGQRFGLRKNTHLVGKEIVRNSLKEAVWTYLAKEGKEREEARKFRENLRKTNDMRRGLKECPRNLKNEIILMNHLVTKPNDYAGALRNIPKKFRRMFVHAYQSYLWNETAKTSKEGRIPLIGFRTDLAKYKSGKQMEKILEKEGVKPEDFLLRSMPELSSEGGERERIVFPERMGWKFEKDELNEGKLKLRLKFEIPRGSYATTLIKEITGNNINYENR